MDVRFHLQQAAMCIDHLGVGLHLHLVPFLVFREHNHGHAQHHAFTAPAVLSFGHR